MEVKLTHISQLTPENDLFTIFDGANEGSEVYREEIDGLIKDLEKAKKMGLKDRVYIKPEELPDILNKFQTGCR